MDAIRSVSPASINRDGVAGWETHCRQGTDVAVRDHPWVPSHSDLNLSICRSLLLSSTFFVPGQRGHPPFLGLFYFQIVVECSLRGGLGGSTFLVSHQDASNGEVWPPGLLWPAASLGNASFVGFADGVSGWAWGLDRVRDSPCYTEALMP